MKNIYAVYAALSNKNEALLAMGPSIYEAEHHARATLQELIAAKNDRFDAVASVIVRQWHDAPQGGFWRTIFVRHKRGRGFTRELPEDHGHVAA